MAEAPMLEIQIFPSNFKSPVIPIAPLVAAAVFFIIFVALVLWMVSRSFNQQVNQNGLQEAELQVAGDGVPFLVREQLPKFTYHSECSSSVPFEQSMCTWCLSDFADGEQLLLLPSCGHVFHSDCIGDYLSCRTACPCCRKTISVQEVHD